MLKHFKEEQYKHKQHIYLKRKKENWLETGERESFHYKTRGRVCNGQLTKPLAEMVFYIPMGTDFHDKLKGSHAFF